MTTLKELTDHMEAFQRLRGKGAIFNNEAGSFFPKVNWPRLDHIIDEEA